MIVSEIVEVCVFKRVGVQVMYLLLQRAADQMVYPDAWQIVTGRILPRERALDAALREFHEETGMTASRFWAVPHCAVFYDQDLDAVHVSPFFAIEVPHDAEPRLSREHQRYAWLPYERARERVLWHGQRQGLDVVHSDIVSDSDAARVSLLPLP